MGLAERRKGKAGEQKAAVALRDLWPDCHSLPTGSEAREGHAGRDLGGTPGYCVQVKMMDSPTPIRGLYEARRAAVPGEVPICAARRTSAPLGQDGWTITIGIEDFKRLARAYEELAGEAGFFEKGH